MARREEERKRGARSETCKSALDRFLRRRRGDPFLSRQWSTFRSGVFSPRGVSPFPCRLAGFPWLPFLPWPNKLVVTKESRSRPAGWLAGWQTNDKITRERAQRPGNKVERLRKWFKGRAREPVEVNSLHECPRIGHNLASEWKPTGMNGVFARPRPRRAAPRRDERPFDGYKAGRVLQVAKFIVPSCQLEEREREREKGKRTWTRGNKWPGISLA